MAADDLFPDLARNVDRNGWRLDALDRWRDQMEKRVSVLESQVLTEKQARILSEALARQGRLRLSKWEKIAGILVGAVAVTDLVLSALGHK